MKVFKYLLAYFKRFSAKHGYTCDNCGREIFDYPTHRICEECENALVFNVDARCEKCGRKTPVVGVCLNCKSKPPVYKRGFSPLVYKGGTSKLINRFKNGRQRLGFYLGELMAKSVLENVPKTETLYLLPVPLSPDRLQARGYNQAQTLALGMQSTLQENGYTAEIRCDILTAKSAPAQKHLSYAERKRQAEQRYRVQDKLGCKDKTFLLVDDILTTGATGNACAEKLLTYSAKDVYFATACAVPDELTNRL